MGTSPELAFELELDTPAQRGAPIFEARKASDVRTQRNQVARAIEVGCRRQLPVVAQSPLPQRFERPDPLRRQVGVRGLLCREGVVALIGVRWPESSRVDDFPGVVRIGLGDQRDARAQFATIALDSVMTGAQRQIDAVRHNPLVLDEQSSARARTPIHEPELWRVHVFVALPLTSVAHDGQAGHECVSGPLSADQFEFGAGPATAGLVAIARRIGHDIDRIAGVVVVAVEQADIPFAACAECCGIAQVQQPLFVDPVVLRRIEQRAIEGRRVALVASRGGGRQAQSFEFEPGEHASAAIEVGAQRVAALPGAGEFGQIERRTAATPAARREHQRRAIVPAPVDACPQATRIVAAGAQCSLAAGAARAARDDIDHAEQRVAAVQRGTRPAHDFDALGQFQIDQ
ncbi:MAG: hypothetical protein IOMNBAOH_01333 [Rhodocyclaceae bacterium]|nr:hypothetical protein [Rhodocyclaceae bacterium]